MPLYIKSINIGTKYFGVSIKYFVFSKDSVF